MVEMWNIRCIRNDDGTFTLQAYVRGVSCGASSEQKLTTTISDGRPIWGCTGTDGGSEASLAEVIKPEILGRIYRG